jgi:hypothetical protein
MTASDILLAAAALAEHQPSASTAIRAALLYTDRFPSAVAALEAAEHRERSVSLAITLARHCSSQPAVAGAFRHAAGLVTA